MLEERILSKFLPPQFDQLESFIAPDFYAPWVVDDDDASMKWQMKRFKHLQETKRTWLSIHMHAYDVNTEHDERQYQHALAQFEGRHGMALSQSLRAYLDHRYDRQRQDLYAHMAFVRRTLMRRRRQRQRLARTQPVVGVSPEVIFDDPRHILTSDEREYLSRGRFVAKGQP